MRAKICIRAPKELAAALEVDNKTAPPGLAIRSYYKKGWVITEIECARLSTLINTVEEILELARLALFSM
ncbi:MAG: hypothetical protein GXO42_03090 [bacterium]|nr:hypothetical protein [bacterium]